MLWPSNLGFVRVPFQHVARDKSWTFCLSMIVDGEKTLFTAKHLTVFGLFRIFLSKRRGEKQINFEFNFRSSTGNFSYGRRAAVKISRLPHRCSAPAPPCRPSPLSKPPWRPKRTRAEVGVVVGISNVRRVDASLRIKRETLRRKTMGFLELLSQPPLYKRHVLRIPSKVRGAKEML